MANEYIDVFTRAANDWICEGYSLSITYLAIKELEGVRLAGASIEINPLPSSDSLTFSIQTNDVFAGMLVLNERPKAEILEFLTAAVQGEIHVDQMVLSLGKEKELDFYSEMVVRERWSTRVHLQVSNSRPSMAQTLNLASVDDQLRTCETPFDGLTDLETWLSVNSLGKGPATLQIRVGPPVDIVFDSCSLTDNVLKVVFHAHPKLDLSKVCLSVKGFPGENLLDRRQITSSIKWQVLTNSLQEGVAEVEFRHADSALIMLSLDNVSVTRQWILDSGKARNSRFVAMQMFDANLQKVREAVIDPRDAKRFELGVNALLFLMGFSAAIQLQTDAPDIIVTTPGGKVVLIECTTKTADFATKIGKLVDRRGALNKLYQASQHPLQVFGVLVCGSPRDQIRLGAADLEGYDIIILAKEDLETAMANVRFSRDPDELISSLTKKLDQRNLFAS